ncbi:MAG TPA: RHS repeat-associated core domain-containing protein [Streptosporangiaceae bacterium]|nr:RHS repeat-associated core domain-containing protein [Streptosporangiaceae bacterium]
MRTLTAGARWEILSGDHEYPIAARDAGQPRNDGDGALDVYGISRQDVTNTYDPATGFLLEQATTRTSSNGETEQISRTLQPAWRVPRYAALAAARMLTAQAAETITNVTRQVTVSSTATTYRADWQAPAEDGDPAEQAAPAENGAEAEQGVWAEHEAWTWLGGQAIAPEFDYGVDAPRPGWRRDEAFTARGRFGQPYVSVDVSGVATSTLFDASGQHEVATLVNVDLLAAPTSASYLGFESYEDQQGWHRVDAESLDDLIVDDDAHTGRRALRLPGQSDGSPVEASFEIPAGSGRLLLDGWVKTEPVFPAGDQAGWQIQLRSAAGVEASRFLPIPDTGGFWLRLWTYLDPPDPAAATSVTCRLVNFVVGRPVLIDDVRFAPLLGGLDAQVYEQPTFAVSAALDTNNSATSYYYDEFGRQLAAIDNDRRVREVTEVSFALGAGQEHGAGQERFDPGSPNAQITVTPAGSGFIEEFRDGSGWRARWDAAPPEDWAAADAVLWHAGTSPGTVTLLGSDEFACYGICLDFRRPDTPSLLAETGPGEAPGRPVGGIAIGRVSVIWDPSGEWRLLDGTDVVDRAPARALRSGRWLLVATDHAVTFFVDGTLVLRHWFADQVSGPLKLIAGGQELGFTRIMVFHQPRLAIQYADGCGQPRQLQQLGDEGTLASGSLPDQFGRPAITTKAMLYDAEPPGYRPRFVTSIDWATGRLTGDLAEYYAGGERSDDDGFPYSRTLLESAETGREIESGQPGATLAVDGSEAHTARLGYAANVASGFLDNLPAGQYPQLRLTDQNGNTTLRYTDRAGNLIGTRDVPGPAGADADGGDRDERTSFSYDGRGALTTVYPPNYYAPPDGADPDRYVITRTVDGTGQLLTTHSSDEGTTEYVYDRSGLQRFVLTQAGRSAAPGDRDWVLYYCYDRLGRPTETGQVAVTWDREELTALAETDWPVDAPDWYERLDWDGDGSAANAIGQHTASTRNLGPGQPVLQVSLDYDQAGQVIRYTERLTGEQGWQADYGYLGTGELTRIEYPRPPVPGSGPAEVAHPMVVTYGYDLLGRLTAIGTPEVPDRYASYAYNADGGLEREVVGLAGPDRLSRRYRVNSPGWPVSIESDALTERISYWESPGYEGARYYDGRIARLDLTASARPEESWRFAYHRDGRLRVAQCLNAPEYSIGVGEPVSFDGNGNLLTAEDAGTRRAFRHEPGTNRLSAISPEPGSYSYDPAGSVRGTPEPRHLRLDTDLVSGLVTGIATTEGRQLNLRYGLGANRLSSDLRDVDGGSLATRRYLFGAGGAPLVERLTGPEGSTEIAYVHGIGGIIGLISGDVQAGVVKDRLGSSRLLVAQAGELLGGYSYRPFGDALGGVIGSRPDLLRYRFTGQEWDGVTGLYNFGARLYDPLAYSFYQPDPDQSSHLSPYAFVSGDPLNLTDPDGEFAWVPLLIAMGIGALAGGISGGIASGSNISEGRFWAYAGIGAGVGALGGALGYGAGAAVTAGITSLGYTAASTTSAGFILSGMAAGAVGGAVDGAVTGGLTQLFGNIVDGKSGSAVWDGVDNAAGWGALTGAGAGALTGAATGLMIRRSFSGRHTVMGAHRHFRPYVTAIGNRPPVPRTYDLTRTGRINRAFNRGGATKVATHGYDGGNHLEFNARPLGGPPVNGPINGTNLGGMFRGRFTSVELLACYPGKGTFAQSFATASRTATRAPTGYTRYHGGVRIGTWSFERGHRVLTFYPNRYVTGFVRLFGY